MFYIGTNGYDQMEECLQTNFTSSQTAVCLNSDMPLFLPYAKNKPCLSLMFTIEDFTEQMQLKNWIRNSLNFLLNPDEISVEEFKIFRNRVTQIERYLLHELPQKNKINNIVEQIRFKKLIAELKLIKLVCQILFAMPDDFGEVQFLHLALLESVEKINNYLNEPMLSFFPDIHLWLCSGDQPVGICSNLKSNDALWSCDELKRGAICNRFIYTDVKVAWVRK